MLVTLQAEFPDFEFAQSMAVMERLVSVSDVQLRRMRQDLAKQQRCSARVLGLDAQLVVRDMDHLTPQVT